MPFEPIHKHPKKTMLPGLPEEFHQKEEPKYGKLTQLFGVPPFSFLDATQGYWQDRKRTWIALGIKGEEGRQDTGGANNICSDEWGRGGKSDFYDENPDRCGGHGLSESQGRLNTFKLTAEARALEPGGGGGPNSAWLGRKPDPSLEKARAAIESKGEGQLFQQGSIVTNMDHPYRRAAGTRPPVNTAKHVDPVPGGGGPNSVRRLAPKDAGKCFGTGRPGDIQESFAAKTAEEKGYGFAAEQNAGLDETTQRALGVYAAVNGAVQERGGGGVAGTSVFDPVLCELMYQWFGKPGGSVLDPFAGESTKGIVAGWRGFSYTGCELRQSQIDANNRQAEEVAKKAEENGHAGFVPPTWIQGDSAKLEDVLQENLAEKFDFIFTSPPYYDLEIYSASEKDGSAFETYDKFMLWYENIFRQAVARLNDNRFLCVKIGEIRDENGMYRNFVGDNISVFRRLGLHYYNEIILVTARGSLPVRVRSQFPKYRKIGKTHQNVLVFWKGEPSNKAIIGALGPLTEHVMGAEGMKA
jgi:DNA modification methylase